jgi:hypothetical protein
MMSYAGFALLFVTASAFAQTPDAFTGNWKLNITKSTPGQYSAGIRSYEPVAGGTRVTYAMTRADGTQSKGEYTTECSGGKCTSEQTNWVHKGVRKVTGQLSENGKAAERYVREVLRDGKTMKITFYQPVGKKTPLSVQIWEKQ